MEKRTRGYVVGSDFVFGEQVWKVRVKQRGHLMNGKKLPVASTRDNFQLAEALNVTFLIGYFGPKGEQEKAVDVMVASA